MKTLKTSIISHNFEYLISEFKSGDNNNASLLNYVPQVFLWPTCLVSYVLSCLTCLLSYVLSCPKCSCNSRALVPTVLLCPTFLKAYLPLAPCALRPTCSCVSRTSCLTCLVLYVDSCLALYEPFFLTYPIVLHLAFSMP